MTDNALILAVTRAQQGDTRAFDCLVRQFQNPAVAYARTILRNPVAAEDAAQEAFVQAWRDLPSLENAATFGGWLRRIVFKYCDRVRRSARSHLPLSDMLELPHYLEPAFVVEQAGDAAQVRDAVDSLPETLRETTLLYYLTGRNIKEIALFLELPPSTVKNRLHAARKQLRKDLWIMAETILEKDKPSQNDAFAENVLSRVLKEFARQESADRFNVDRGLLDEGETALFELLAKDEPLDVQTVRDGLTLLSRKLNHYAIGGLMMRYFGQPLSDSETAWAYVHLARAFADSNAAACVLTHETFERWLPGKSPVLSVLAPYYPVSEDDPNVGYVGDEVRLLFLMSSQFCSAYRGIWRNKEYLAKVDVALSQIPVAPRNRRQHFDVLRTAVDVCECTPDLERAARFIQRMHDLAAGAEDEVLKLELTAAAMGCEVNLARGKNDEQALPTAVERLTVFLNDAELKDGKRASWVCDERHNLACQLVWGNRHELALPLWEANANGGMMGGWAGVMHAATIWKLTGDRERTIEMLRVACAYDDRDIKTLLAECSEFEDVRDDPEFLKAIGRG